VLPAPEATTLAEMEMPIPAVEMPIIPILATAIMLLQGMLLETTVTPRHH